MEAKFDTNRCTHSFNNSATGAASSTTYLANTHAGLRNLSTHEFRFTFGYIASISSKLKSMKSTMVFFDKFFVNIAI